VAFQTPVSIDLVLSNNICTRENMSKFTHSGADSHISSCGLLETYCAVRPEATTIVAMCGHFTVTCDEFSSVLDSVVVRVMDSSTNRGSFVGKVSSAPGVEVGAGLENCLDGKSRFFFLSGN